MFRLRSSDGLYAVWARKVVLTTGGLSYPTTGSDGTGYGIAESFGHAILKTFPALTPLLANDPDWKNLSGVALAVKLSFFKKGKKVRECHGSLLFTHFGFSGPAALDISRHLASAAKGDHPEIVASLLPDEDEWALKAAFQSVQKKSPKKVVKKFLAEGFLLPARFVEPFLKKIGVSGAQPIENFQTKTKKGSPVTFFIIRWKRKAFLAIRKRK